MCENIREAALVTGRGCIGARGDAAGRTGESHKLAGRTAESRKPAGRADESLKAAGRADESRKVAETLSASGSEHASENNHEAALVTGRDCMGASVERGAGAMQESA